MVKDLGTSLAFHRSQKVVRLEFAGGNGNRLVASHSTEYNVSVETRKAEAPLG
jgi:hypothetical protein